jgi:hypothetical protein
MKMQVRHIHTLLQGTRFLGLGREIVAVSDSEDVTRRSTDYRSRSSAIESECIPAIFIHGPQRKGRNVILRSDLRRFQQGSSLSVAQTCHDDGCAKEK